MKARTLAGLMALLGALSVVAGPEAQESGGEDLAQHRIDLLGRVDPASGAVLQAPAVEGSDGTCHIIDSVWASAALDALGLHDQAARALAVHLATVRAVSGIDTPSGSLPRVIRPDGKAASFWGNADPESAAWLLAACWRHSVSLPAPERAAYLEPVWPQLSLAADYLAREPVVGGALSGALPAGAAPLDLLRSHYLGLESSRRAAEALGKAEPTLWSDRRSEIYSRIRFRTLNQTGDGGALKPWVDWWIGLMPGGQSNAGWDVLKTAGAPALTESAIAEWAVEESGEVPLARKDGLRCLMGFVASGG